MEHLSSIIEHQQHQEQQQQLQWRTAFLYAVDSSSHGLLLVSNSYSLLCPDDIGFSFCQYVEGFLVNSKDFATAL
jgi:hypothetical protein